MTLRPASRRFKNAVYEQFARIAKALSSPRRIELLEILTQAPRTVEALASLTEMSVANASQHLKVLRAAGLVEAAKNGLYVSYRIADPQVPELLLMVRRVAEACLAEVEKIGREFLSDNGLLEPVDAAALRKRVLDGEVTLLDVRPPEEYRAGHLPGALSVPQPELAKRLSELPRRREVVAYCHGPYCVLVVEAVKLLRSRGFKAARLQEGVLEWEALGLPLEPRTAEHDSGSTDRRGRPPAGGGRAPP